VSLFSKLKNVWQTRFGQVDERILYRAFNDSGVTRWCEIGIGDGQRTLRLIKLLKNNGRADELFFCGVDPFEARKMFGQPVGLQLKEAHRQFKETGIKTQLIPGDPFTALSRSANSINNLQLVIIDADQEGESLDRAMFYLPRMLAPKARVFMTDESAKEGYRELSAQEIATRANVNRRRAAA
jgi:hypothetical protein